MASTPACSPQQEWASLFTASTISLLYVFSLYIHPSGPKLVGFPTRPRDDPVEIRSRFQKVFVVSILSFLLSVSFQVFSSSKGTIQLDAFFEALSNMGISSVHPWTSIFEPLLLTIILFAGPILGDYFGGRWRGYSAFLSLLRNNLHFRRRILRDTIYNPIWCRAYIVAPISEEFVYRACLIPVVKLCYGAARSVFISPLLFGVAHLHHIVDRIRLGASVRSAVLTSLFQIAYTSLFGMYSAYLLLTTKSILAPTLVHGLCNYLGVPDLEVLTRMDPVKRITVAFAYFGGLIAWIILMRPFSLDA